MQFFQRRSQFLAESIKPRNFTPVTRKKKKCNLQLSVKSTQGWHCFRLSLLCNLVKKFAPKFHRFFGRTKNNVRWLGNSQFPILDLSYPCAPICGLWYWHCDYFRIGFETLIRKVRSTSINIKQSLVRSFGLTFACAYSSYAMYYENLLRHQHQLLYMKEQVGWISTF